MWWQGRGRSPGPQGLPECMTLHNWEQLMATSKVHSIEWLTVYEGRQSLVHTNTTFLLLHEYRNGISSAELIE